MVLYVDDILLATNNLDLLHETNTFLSKNFEIKDMSEASYVIQIEIFSYRSQGLLKLLKKHLLIKFWRDSRWKIALQVLFQIRKGKIFRLKQCLKNELKYKQMKKILYASNVGKIVLIKHITTKLMVADP